MADLRRDRGQILLIAAFAMSVIFIALALVVNGAIFTENLASQGESSGGSAVLEMRSNVNTTFGSAIMHANQNESLPSSAYTAEYTPPLQSQFQNYTALTGVDIRFSSVTVTQTGLYINDSARSTNTFESTTPTADWWVAEDVDDVRAFQLFVRGDQVDTVGGGSFTVNITHRLGQIGGSGEDMYRLEIGTSSGEPAIRVDAPGDTQECTLPGKSYPLHIDVMEARFGGEYCAALDNLPFGTGIDDDYNIIFNNSNEVNGNFSLVTRNGNIPDPTLFGTSPSPEFKANAIYAAEVTVDIWSADIHFKDVIRVAPKEDEFVPP